MSSILPSGDAPATAATPEETAAEHAGTVSEPQPGPGKNAAAAVRSDASAESEKPEPAAEYVTGLKLAVVVAAVAVASFLMLLDTMIVSTVGSLSV